ncbi:hypothetical protein ABZ599_33815 [Streptomyces misionensis]
MTPFGARVCHWWPLSWLRGTYFPLAVVDVDTTARTAHGLV